MSEGKINKTVYLKDYCPPDYQIKTVHLSFYLGEEHTRVYSKLSITRSLGKKTPLILHGEALKLLSIQLNGQLLTESAYQINSESLTLHQVPDYFILEIETKIYPQKNTTLSGLYVSEGNFCTQCEAEGFRRITYFLDCPDVMATYTTTIIGNKEKYPVLLSNGNLIDQGDKENGEHFAIWQDPFPKPSYLFALVAGKLSSIQDKFITLSRREVNLSIYVQPHNIEKCTYAMASLKRSMAWDEQVYGREYDLDNYMIVAVDDFNMGAMENKGLNIFNSKFVLANPETATDTDYQYIEGVIGHEYFHNWSGNRVTCRDWFQLSLKEGFTVFRDQQFSASQSGSVVKRIEDVNRLRTYQFREDAGPMAHPVRPESYEEINNFYTVTIYEKGAEVVRMLHTLLGETGFRKGTDLYFERHNGQAVTTDDFVKALEDANQVDFSQFRLWYSQAGTPELHVQSSYDADQQTYSLKIKQACPPTPDQPYKKPFHLPLTIGLLDSQGKDIPLQLVGENNRIKGTQTLEIKNQEETFTFENISMSPTPSLLRGFSAPVKLHFELSDKERCFLLAYDNDSFNRWEAGQQLAVKIILSLTKDYQEGNLLKVSSIFIEAIAKFLENYKTDNQSFIAQLLILPSEHYLSEFMEVIDPEALYQARTFLRKTLAHSLKDYFNTIYHQLTSEKPYSFNPQEVARRTLRNICLGYLMMLDETEIHQRCFHQFKTADNMTDSIAALSYLADTKSTERESALSIFYERWKQDSLVMDKWLSIQASAKRDDTFEIVEQLSGHSAFKLTNPNKVRALIGTFCQNNLVNFHHPSGNGYKFLGEYICKLDPLNPQIAARLVSIFSFWKRYDPKRQTLMKDQLEQISRSPNLSKDVQEITLKSLKMN
ncbi:aminopeptidase N [Candidatus Nitrosacidococcus tergens]|uniref:Aminopeptidase N n=1 Tax=Candidatus Nitrosacidococcus tergens TaxID=553981 RepID=A0A7G1Q8S1_9GAMM|nr:aminopeptidase N [Candidatus Nitrosacidococcus tergens]CAB1275215.1 Aminopeptidase N [Candidatus Nitrosacidococcus tergens]